MKIRYLLLIISVFLTFSSKSQQLSGKVIDEYLEELPGINIYDKDTVLLTLTDLDGTFELKNPPSELLLGFVGMEWLSISLTNCTNPEIIMMADVIYHYKSHRKIDRLRKKRYDNRVKIHEQAFKQGIFKSEKPCVNYEFIPIEPELDEIRYWMNEKKIEIKEEFNQLSVGDTVFVPYSGPITSSVHSAYSDYTNYDCIITGIVLKKNKRRMGFNIQYQVIDMEDCIYESLTHKEQEVKVGDIIEYNMKHFRLMTSSNIR